MNKPAGIIILDGPDGSGKTTLAEYYIKQYGARRIHLTYRWVNNMFEYNTAAVDYAARLAAQGELVIIDRLWMSEIVYDLAYRGQHKNPGLGRMIDRMVLKYSGIYVICLPVNTREYLSHFDRLKDSRLELFSTMEKAYFEYDKIWNNCIQEKWPHAFRYDFMDGNMEQDAEMYLEYMLQRRAESPSWQLTEKQFSGSIEHGEVLFLDGAPTNRKNLPTYPRHEYTEANVYLNGIFDMCGIPEHKLMWTDVTAKHIWEPLLSTYDVKPMCLGGHGVYRQVVEDTYTYFKYNKPDVHLSPEQDLKYKNTFTTTFMQHMAYVLMDLFKQGDNNGTEGNSLSSIGMAGTDSTPVE
jgi:thymidylate kinase